MPTKEITIEEIKNKESFTQEELFDIIKKLAKEIEIEKQKVEQLESKII